MTNESGFTPTGDLILIAPLGIDATTKGGIALPEMAVERHQKAVRVGTIVATGEHRTTAIRACRAIEVGDQVLFARYAADELPINGVGYFVMRASSVMGQITQLPDNELAGAESTVATFGVNVP